MIPVTRPTIPDTKKLYKYLDGIHDRAWFTNFGPLHEELRDRLEEYLGVKNLLLVSNGTLALQIAYKALKIQGAALTTPFTFVATSSALVWERIAPSYVDINSNSLCLDPDLLPEDLPAGVNGVVPVHVFGRPADTGEIDSYAERKGLKVVYDGAHAFGVKKGTASVLSAGDATTLSFHATKVFHTVEGGGIVFKNKGDFELAKELINFGFDDTKSIQSIGINSKMNEYQAAVGLTILDEMDSILERRVHAFSLYYEKLKNYVSLPELDKEASLNGAYMPILLKDEAQLLKVQRSLQERQIQTRRYFHPSLNQVKVMGSNVSCPKSEDVASRILCLPIYSSITEDEQLIVISNLVKEL